MLRAGSKLPALEKPMMQTPPPAGAPLPSSFWDTLPGRLLRGLLGGAVFAVLAPLELAICGPMFESAAHRGGSGSGYTALGLVFLGMPVGAVVGSVAMALGAARSWPTRARIAALVVAALGALFVLAGSRR